MTKFDDVAGPLDGKVKTDFDPKWQNMPPQKHELTNLSTSDPHFLRFSVRRAATVEELQAGKKGEKEIMSWGMRFPTRDAADSHKADIEAEMRHMRGEPEQAWADVIKLAGGSRVPNASLILKFKNLHMELVPAPQPKPEPIPRDHPAYPGSFRAHLDAVTGQPHGEPKPDASGSASQAGNGADQGGPGEVRAVPAKRARKVPSGGSSRKAAKSKPKQGKAKASRRSGD